jgi:predicted DCC family thiol-disulfide oxidoreductase YuxK
MNRFLDSLLATKISSKNLSLFRITFFSVLLAEVIRLNYFKVLIFDKIPYFSPGELEMGNAFFVWFIVLGFIIIGFKTRFFLIINYVISVILIGTINTYEYHMFYAYMGINFLCILIPMSKSLSIDNLLERLNGSTTRKIHMPEENVPQFHYYMLLFFGVAIVYFDSILYKFSSPMWRAGLGMWHPGSMPFAVNSNFSWLLNQEFTMKFLGYLTIAFECVFIFFFWNKWFRWHLLLIGVGLHVGIYLLFPIPQFALGVICLYLLMLPENFWSKFKIKQSKNPILFFYDAECPLCLRTRIVIEFFDIFKRVKFLPIQGYYDDYKDVLNKPYEECLDNIYSINNQKVYSGVYTYINVWKKMIYTFPIGLLIQIPGIIHLAKKVYEKIASNRNTERCNEENCEVGFSPVVNSEKVKLFKNYSVNDVKNVGLKFAFYLLLILQLNTSLRSPFISDLIYKVKLDKIIFENNKSIMKYSKQFFGITNHPVFMDFHFKGYNHIIRVDYVEGDKHIVLPIINEKGMASDYIVNFNWVKWTFRVNNAKINQVNLHNGIRDFSAFWLHQEFSKVKLDKAYRFKIYCKKIDSPNGFEDDFLNRQIAKPWIEVGEATWINKEFVCELPNIEGI